MKSIIALWPESVKARRAGKKVLKRAKAMKNKGHNPQDNCEL